MTVPRRSAIIAGVIGVQAVLRPAIGEAARRVGAKALGLVDIGCGAGLDLTVDLVGVTYDHGEDVRTAGDPSSPVQVRTSVVGDQPVPLPTLPEVVARIGVDRAPFDATGADEAQVSFVATAAPPVQRLHGDVVARLADAVSLVPTDALPVVTTTWSLARLKPGRRQRFIDELVEVAAHRPIAWVSVEGVGVAPGVPTLGDRPASGHSIIAVAILDGAHRSVDAVGRCWSRGRWMSWFEAPVSASSAGDA